MNKNPSPRDWREEFSRMWHEDGLDYDTLKAFITKVEQEAEKRAFEKGRKEGVDVAERMAKVAILAREAAFKDKLRERILARAEETYTLDEQNKLDWVEEGVEIRGYPYAISDVLKLLEDEG